MTAGLVFGTSVALLLALFSLNSSCMNLDNVDPNADTSEIHGYHFHTYYFQKNALSTSTASTFREEIQAQIDSGRLAGCRLNRFNEGPVGPHPVGSFETCCNNTAISPALSWFMQNRGNLTILLHPLTRYEVLDHTERAMFLGPRVPLDITVLSNDLGNIDLCLPITN